MSELQETDVVMRLRKGRAATSTLRFRAGEPVQPLSIGQGGWWSIEAEGVEQLHAYVYFDGQSLLAKAVYLHNPPLLDGYPVRDKWTKLPCPSVLGLGSARILVDRVQRDESEVVPGTVMAGASPSPDVPVPVEEEPSRARGSHPGAATQVLGSQFVELVTTRAGGAPSPKTTARLDVEEMWFRSTEPLPSPSTDLEVGAPPADVQDIAPASDIPPSTRGLSRAASMRKVIVVLASVAAMLVLVLAGIDPRTRSLASSMIVKKQATPVTAATREEPTRSAPAASVPEVGTTRSLPPTLPIANSGRSNAARSPDRTLEREAADAVARADYPLAVRRYQELSAAHPDRLVFRECARILAKKAATGTP